MLRGLETIKISTNVSKLSSTIFQQSISYKVSSEHLEILSYSLQGQYLHKTRYWKFSIPETFSGDLSLSMIQNSLHMDSKFELSQL